MAIPGSARLKREFRTWSRGIAEWHTDRPRAPSQTSEVAEPVERHIRTAAIDDMTSNRATSSQNAALAAALARAEAAEAEIERIGVLRNQVGRD